MKDEMRERLREEFQDYEARHDYADLHLDSSIALQIKALRLQRGWTQKELASRAEMHQSQVSEMEQVTHSSWTLETLKRVARAFDLSLKLSFESFGTLLYDYINQSGERHRRPSFEDDPAFSSTMPSSADSEESNAANNVLKFEQPERFVQVRSVDLGTASG